jgi:uncharacterized protein YlxW (UPF0749 family)
MVWLVILMGLLIPLAVVVLDSPAVRSWAERRSGKDLPDDVKDLAKKVNVLENELEALTRQMAQLQESQQFVQRLLENPSKSAAPEDRPLPRRTE